MSGERNPRNPNVNRDLFGAKQKGKNVHDDLTQIKKALTDFHKAVQDEAKKQGHYQDDETTSAPGTPVKKTPGPGKQ